MTRKFISYNGKLVGSGLTLLSKETNLPTPPSFINTYSLDFDGMDDYIDCGNSAALKPNIITVSCWVKGSTQTAYTRIISQDGPTGGADAYGFYVTTALNKVVFAIKTDVTGTVTSATSGVVLDNNWHHLVGTYDGSEVILYVDGVAVGSPSAGTSILSYGSGTLTIGCFSEPTSLPSYLFNGNIDEVSIFNSVIPIGDLWDGSGQPTDLSLLATPPVAWYRMGDNGAYKSPQWLLPSNENKDKVSNYSFEFDGVDDYVDIGNAISFEYTDAFSYSFWVKPDAVAGVKNLYSKYDSLIGGRGILMYHNSSGAATPAFIYFAILSTNGGSTATRKRITTQTGNILTKGVWNNIVITYDGSGLGSGIKLYKNGVSQTVTVTQDNLQNSTILNNTNSYLGASSSGTATLLGNLDEWAIFNTELSSADALAIYNGGEPTTLPSGAVAHYKMGEEANFTSNWLVDNSALTNYSKRSFEFDGVDDYVDLGSSSTVADGGQFSLSFWIKGTSQSAGAKYLFSADYYNLNTYWTIQNTELYWRDINNVYKLLSTNLLDGEWHHILIIWNPDGANSTIRCFTDGVNEVNIATDFRYAPGWNGGAYQGGLQYIGNRGGGTFSGFNGSIDEFAVWDNDQSSNVLDIYNGGEPTTISGAVAHYKMGEDASFDGTNWTVPDNVGSNDGTSDGMMVDALVGEAPNYSGGGISNAMTIQDRVGNAPNSENNALSYNMDLVDRVTDTP